MILCVVFFLSGASALLFETLWFRLAGLMLGNSVWASSLVLASFMGGLALGNGLAARHGRRLTRLVRAYAILESVVGGAGLGLVLLLPRLTGLLAPVLHPFLDRPWALNGLRLVVAFALMVVPTTAMGATLPILVKAMTRSGGPFGRALGRLYGWNTLGACAGALAGEGLLIELLGLRGTAFFATLLNALAVLVALRAAGAEPTGGPPRLEPCSPRPLLARPLLGATFLAGGLLLALEVVWFRFLLLFVQGTSLTFSVMLAVVLLGISAGSLLASVALRWAPDPRRSAAGVALLAGAFTASLYLWFDEVFRPFAGPYVVTAERAVFLLALALMGPVCVLSGALFTLLGTALRRGGSDETESAGALTLANTVGAMLGALGAGFLLLPRLGTERSLFGLAACYGVVAWCALGRSSGAPRTRGLLALAGVFVLALACFPFGLMRDRYLRRVADRYADDGSTLVAVREGLTETILYQRKDLWGEAAYFRLLTDGYSMAGTEAFARRYMTLFVYWPVAMRPDPRRALLISYGAGATAKALTETKSLESIDVVDISRDILELGRLVYPDPGTFPLDDPRVRVHVEDGRFFLLTTDRRFDLITGEPPPPKNAGVVNLYTRDYFQLVHDRLEPGGIATYWLPVADLGVSDTRAIVKAFCSAFEDCSLWTGSYLDWMLAGSRGARGPVDEAGFRRQWDDPRVVLDLRAVGFETPEQLGALFIGDAAFLAQLTHGAEPLTDDRPARLSPHMPGFVDPFYVDLMDTRRTRRRFEESALIAERWPAALRKRTLPAFDQQALINATFLPSLGLRRVGDFRAIRDVLENTPLRTLPLMLLESSDDEQRIVARVAARGVEDPVLDAKRGVGALAARDYEAAEDFFARAEASGASLPFLREYRRLAAELAARRK
jgi:spermidine synthase